MDKQKGAAKPNRINRLLLEKAKKDFASLSNLVMIKNLGLNSEETTEVRSGMREKGITLQVVRNRISILAFREMGVEEAEKLFDGPTAVIEAEDPVVAAKIATEFCEKFDKKLAIVGGLVEGKVVDAKGVVSLSKSKSRPELLADIAGIALSPGARLAGALVGPGGRLAAVVKAVIEKLEGDGGEDSKDEAA